MSDPTQAPPEFAASRAAPEARFPAHAVRSEGARRLARGLFMYAALAAALCCFWPRPLLLMALLLLLAAGYLWRVERRLRLFVCAGALLGPAAEGLAILAGAWRYTDSATLIPLWLPPAWGLACACLVDIVEGLSNAGPARAAQPRRPAPRE